MKVIFNKNFKKYRKGGIYNVSICYAYGILIKKNIAKEYKMKMVKNNENN